MSDIYNHYMYLVANGEVIFSEDQLTIIRRLDKICTSIYSHKFDIINFFKLKFSKYKVVKGVYLYGEVGRGKSFLMELFFKSCKSKKRRVHFHDFMQEVHNEVLNMEKPQDLMLELAEKIAQNSKILCFDELHINDIGDAMILARLFKGLFDKGVFIFLTSNYHPDELYKDGMHRDRFLPAIELIKSGMEIIQITGDRDYRLLNEQSIFFIESKESLQLNNLFNQLTMNENIEVKELSVCGRCVKINKSCENIVWFEYEELCKIAFGAADYKAIAKQFKVIFIAGIEKFEGKDELRRFIVMIDQFYENGIILCFSTTIEIASLAKEFEFERTLSRIIDMNDPVKLQSIIG